MLTFLASDYNPSAVDDYAVGIRIVPAGAPPVVNPDNCSEPPPPSTCPVESSSPQLQGRRGSDAFALNAGGSGALSVSTARFRVNASSFRVQGSVHGLSLGGAETLVLTVGDLEQPIPAGQIRSHGTKMKFKARKGAPGLAALTIDGKKGTFTALGGDISLANLPNPARVGLTAGGFEGCTLIKLRAKRRRSGVLASLAFSGTDQQFACIIPEEPLADPPAFLVSEPTPVSVRAQVVSDPDLDPSSVKLWRVDEALNPVGSALGALLDSGEVASDGSRTFVTTHTFVEPNPTDVRLQVSANVTSGGGSLTVWSPSFTLAVTSALVVAP